VTSLNTEPEHGPIPSVQQPAGRLASKSFLGLLVTQFLGATNDNIFRWLVIGIGKDFVEPHQVAGVLSAGLACFVLPYLLLAAPAGYLADRYSKRAVIVGCKVAEVAIMLLGVAAIWFGNVYLLFAVVALMGCQSALFGPSKLGSIPEILPAEKISAANGLVGLTTVMATVLGAAIGNLLADLTGYRGTEQFFWASAVALVSVAATGWAASLLIAPLPVANPSRTFPYNAAAQTVRDLKLLFSNVPLTRVALGLAFFWSLGSLSNLNIDQFGFEGQLSQQTQLVPLLFALVCGVGVGSVLAGVWSGGKVELGILPLGAGAVALSSMLLFTVPDSLINGGSLWTGSYLFACGCLFFLGTGAGLFDVPLSAFMQHRSPRASRGSILAATNFLTFGGMFVMSLVYPVLRTPVGPGAEPFLSARAIFGLSGLLTIPIFVYIVWLLPQASIRFVVWLASHTIYRVRVVGRDRLPAEGGALLVPNHVSWIDGVLLLLASSRPVRIVAAAPYVNFRGARWLARVMGVIPMDSGPQSIRRALDTAREALDDGQLVCIFPEGGITQTGRLQPFKRGLARIAEGIGAPVIPVYLDGLWGSIFSYSGGRAFWKRPRRWPYPVWIHFGPAVADPQDIDGVRQAVADLGRQAVEQRMANEMIPPRAFLRMCRRNRSRAKLADSTGKELTGGALLVASLVFRRLLKREVLESDEQYVGVLVPPSIGGVLTNVALPLCGRTAVNLNYTVSSDVMNNCIAQCGIRHVLTSRRVVQKLDLQIHAELVYLEDLLRQVKWTDKVMAGAAAYLAPLALLERFLGLNKVRLDDVLTVIFTSGSTGDPKGVMLTHRNVASNIQGIDEAVHLSENDVLIGTLPFFHSYGYTATMWTALVLDPKGVFHFSPLEPKVIGELCATHRVTILMSTPTFLRSYLRRCQPEHFASLDVVFGSAERLPSELSDAFEKKFGVRPLEAYGATELSPLVSVNIPPHRYCGDAEAVREGSVGRPIPGVRVKVVHPDTREDLPADQPGMLLVSGPNVMKGYLNKPDLTAEVVRDGWYTTGDIARVDGDGFIHITGRLSRFSKIGGEMVPHIKIEEALETMLGQDEEQIHAAVTAVPDAKKGERLVVIHLPLDKTPAEICRELATRGLPNLWIPSTDSFCQVQEIPVLGSGKLDLKRLKDLAVEKFSSAAAAK